MGVQGVQEKMTVAHVPFDKILFNIKRLDVVASLDGEGCIPFTELMHVLKMTAGNLGSHVRALESHDLVAVHKSFRGKKPHTTLELTVKGRKEFDKLKEWFYHSFIEEG